MSEQNAVQDFLINYVSNKEMGRDYINSESFVVEVML